MSERTTFQYTSDHTIYNYQVIDADVFRNFLQTQYVNDKKDSLIAFLDSPDTLFVKKFSAFDQTLQTILDTYNIRLHEMNNMALNDIGLEFINQGAY